MSHYDTLGITPEATALEIKQAWRRKCKDAHPDREGGSHEAMAAINKAYEVLGDDKLKANYDETGEDELIDPLDVSARTTMCMHFMEVVVDAPDNADLVTETYGYLGKKITMAQANISEANAAIGKLQRRANRIKIKTKGADNFLVAAIDQRIALMTPGLEKAKDDVAVLTRAREMLLEYKDKDAGSLMKAIDPRGWNKGATIGSIAHHWPEGS